MIIKGPPQTQKNFQGKRRKWTGPPIKLELKEDAQPYHSRSYQIPHLLVPVMKRKMKRIKEIEVINSVCQMGMNVRSLVWSA